MLCELLVKKDKSNNALSSDRDFVLPCGVSSRQLRVLCVRADLPLDMNKDPKSIVIEQQFSALSDPVKLSEALPQIAPSGRASGRVRGRQEPPL